MKNDVGKTVLYRALSAAQRGCYLVGKDGKSATFDKFAYLVSASMAQM